MYFVSGNSPIINIFPFTEQKTKGTHLEQKHKIQYDYCSQYRDAEKDKQLAPYKQGSVMDKQWM